MFCWFENLLQEAAPLFFIIFFSFLTRFSVSITYKKEFSSSFSFLPQSAKQSPFTISIFFLFLLFLTAASSNRIFFSLAAIPGHHLQYSKAFTWVLHPYFFIKICFLQCRLRSSLSWSLLSQAITCNRVRACELRWYTIYIYIYIYILPF